MDPRRSWATPLLMTLVLAATGCKAKSEPEPQPPVATSGASWDGAYSEASTSIEPIEVCEHLARLAAAEQGLDDVRLDPAIMQECERELSLEAATRGTDNWNGIAGCVLRARSGPDIDACNSAHPLPGDGGAGPGPGSVPGPGEGQRELAACVNMLDLIMAEAAAEMGAPAQLSVEEQDQLIGECVSALWNDERPNRPPEDYNQLLRCITDARTGDQVQDC